MHKNDPGIHRKTILSDEAHFHLEGFVNKQNCQIWGSENLRVIVEKRVTVWCGLWSGEVIGPYFFENEAGATVAVNALRYQGKVYQFLRPELDSVDLDNV